jgi:hypothetical protein
MRSLHTPQQETNSAYNPGVSYQGGQFLAQGIAQAGGAIAEGLQRYATNKEEAAALDTRYESTAKPLMEKLSLYGKLADENSPAAALLDKAADWHKLGTSQKKVLLADMMILGDKTEAEQRRKEADQWKMLAAQRADEEFTYRKGLDARDTLFKGLGAIQSNRSHNLAEQDFNLRQQTHADVLKQRAAAEARTNAEREALSGFARTYSQTAGADFAPNAGRGALAPLPEAERFRLALERNPTAFSSPQFNDNLKGLADLGKAGVEAFAPSLGVQKVTLSDGTQVEMPVGRVGPNGAQFFPEFSPSNRKYTDKARTAGERTARPMTDIERHRIVRDNEKDIADLTARLNETNPDKSPKVTGAAYFQMRNQIKRKQDEIAMLEEEAGGDTSAPASPAPAAAAATPQSKAQRANALAAQNPDWTREQVIEAVNREFAR